MHPHTFFRLPDALGFQVMLAGYGWDSRVTIAGRDAYTVRITRPLDD